MDENLIKYIKENKEKGFSDDIIKKALLGAGWKEADINEGLGLGLISAAPPLQKGMPRAPLFVIIVAWIMLLGGIVRLLMSGPALFLGAGLGMSSLIFSGILAILTGVGLIVTSFGLRKMRKWGLYVFTVITGLSLISSIYSIIGANGKDIWMGLVILLIQIAILIDFWTFRRKFI